MEPIMAVWAGFALGGTSVAENQLQPYIQQAIDQINFVIGSTSTAPGALRASLGHPTPFKLNFVEIGNEDFFASNTYTYRWTHFVNSLKAAFPQIRFIATSNTFNPVLSPNPTDYDVHVYQTPTWFAQNSFFYDGFQRNGTKYFEGEYAAISTNPNDIFGTPANGRLVFPTMQSAAGEAAFITGLERNVTLYLPLPMLLYSATLLLTNGHLICLHSMPEMSTDRRAFMSKVCSARTAVMNIFQVLFLLVLVPFSGVSSARRLRTRSLSRFPTQPPLLPVLPSIYRSPLWRRPARLRS